MNRLIVVTHGRLGEALLDSARLILGELPDGARDVCLCPEDNLDSMRAKIAAALDPVEEPGHAVPALALVDLFGGTACNATAWALEGRDFQIVAGVNLPMLLEVLMQWGRLSVEQASRVAVEAGLRSVVDVRAALSQSGTPAAIGS